MMREYCEYAPMDTGLNNDEIAARVRLVRQKFGALSQDAFAKSVGINRTTYTNYETGLSRPRIDHGAAICRKYGLTLDWLYLGEEGGMTLHSLERLGLR